MLPRIVVAGNGQLGQMLQQAGAPMQLEVMPVDPNGEITLDLADSDVITVEIEHWQDTVTGLQLKQHPNLRNADALYSVIDRERQKTLIDRLSIPTAPWVSLKADDDVSSKLAQLGNKAVIKSRMGGYDGRGQWRWQTGEEVESEWAGNCIAEAMIPFSHEVSIVGARNAAGKKVFFPLMRNWHENGVLRATVANLDVPEMQQQHAEAWLGRILDDQNYIGVMAMECFVVDGDLLVNELAPRVHNSGHWSQEGATISQFELHLRALTDLPLITPESRGCTVMYNLLGRNWKSEWLSIDGVHVHWYGKSLRPGRKVGHVNINRPTVAQLRESLTKLLAMVDEDDRVAIQWSIDQLES